MRSYIAAAVRPRQFRGHVAARGRDDRGQACKRAKGPRCQPASSHNTGMIRQSRTSSEPPRLRGSHSARPAARAAARTATFNPGVSCPEDQHFPSGARDERFPARKRAVPVEPMTSPMATASSPDERSLAGSVGIARRRCETHDAAWRTSGAHLEGNRRESLVRRGKPGDPISQSWAAISCPRLP